MLFNSIDFAVFLPIVFFLYWGPFGRDQRFQNSFLLAASYFFYSWWDWRFLSLLLLSSLTDFLVGRFLGRASHSRSRCFLLGLSLTINLGILFTFKYYNFFVDSLNDGFSFFGVETSFRGAEVILPLGLSFFTFQSLSYTIDIYRGQLKPCKSLVEFLGFVSFFPQLVAGPIERASALLPQFSNSRSFSMRTAKDGLRQMLWGLFKKVVIADNCARWVDLIFLEYENLGSMSLWLGVFLFSIQIYCDFSGYSDIAIGVARLFGFDLSRNFRYPYFAKSIPDFWRRWHISLSTWFRDYVYHPLGGNRSTKVKNLRNILIVFLVSGLWHGANWTFVIWGSIHAGAYVFSSLVGNLRATDGLQKSTATSVFFQALRVATTYTIVCISWIFFRSDTLTNALVYLERMCSFHPSNHQDGFITDLGLTGSFILIGFIVEFTQRGQEHALARINELIVLVRWSIYYVLTAFVLIFGRSQQNFLYFQF